MTVRVEVLSEVTDEVVEAFGRLLPQLSGSAPPLDRAFLFENGSWTARQAEAAGARTVDLTSRPSRAAAGRLYERLGFTARESRLYRYALGQDKG